jgi:two-component system cell cycle response regulator
VTARVLVVDDITANLRLLEAKLGAEYYDVAVAGSGAEALATAADWLPDVVLLDVMMPGLDGYEVCRRLKASAATAHIPVVMVTALVDPAERVRGLEAGADDFLSKPVDDATLFTRLRALLRAKQVQDAWRLRAETARELGLEPPTAPALSVQGSRAMMIGEAADAAEVRPALAAEGVAVEQAGSFAAAWQALDDSGFDLIVVGLTEDGAEALRFASRLRAQSRTRDLPMLLLADPAQRAQVLRGFDLGANDHVFRPIDPNELRVRSRNQIRRKRYQDRLRSELDRSLEMAVTDSLTGLRNRRFALRHLDGLLRGPGAAVLMLDVDRFKSINDTHGHAIGDMVLREVAERLKVHLRAADVVARFGGEEFLVVIAGAPVDYAAAVAERLRSAIEVEPIPADGRLLAVTASIGIAAALPGTPIDELLAAADAALYRAKAGGRNRVEVGPELPDRA